MLSAAFRARDEATALVREQVAYVFGMYAYVYGFPMVMMDVTRRVMTAAPNWLPCPPGGRFNVTVRVYQPKPEMLDGRTLNHLVVRPGTYQIPPIQKVSP